MAGFLRCVRDKWDAMQFVKEGESFLCKYNGFELTPGMAPKV